MNQGLAQDRFASLLEDLFDCIDPQTAFVLFAVLHELARKAKGSRSKAQALDDVKQALSACRGTLSQALNVPPSLSEIGKVQNRLFH